MIKGKTQITRICTSKYFLVPANLFNDSTFPFKEEELSIEIIGKGIVIGKKEKE